MHLEHVYKLGIKVTGDSVMFKTLYQKGSYLLLIWMRKILKFHMNNSSYFEISVSL